jgi:hypothetical protein
VLSYHVVFLSDAELVYQPDDEECICGYFVDKVPWFWKTEKEACNPQHEVDCEK